MYATWDFVKRHRRKIATGAGIAATAYGTKCLLESQMANHLMRRYLRGEEEQQGEVINLSTVEDHSLDEARRHFLFDVHQQSCDKNLNNLIEQLRKRIDSRFNTADLLDELRTSQELTAQRKIEIWEQLKLRSLTKILSVITIFPLITLVMKTQKSMICKHLCQSLPSKSPTDNSLYGTGMRFMKSFFYPTDDDHQQQQQSSMTSESSTRAQKLFNESVQYFLANGIDLLFGCLERIASDIFANVKLTEQMSSMDLHFLLERARAKLKAIGAASNFADFVIPTAELNIPSDGRKLQNLLEEFRLILQTQRCRKLMDYFGGQYFEAVLQYMDDTLPEGKCLPVAKLIPRICNAFHHIASNDYSSVFYSTLTSTELHQFTLFVSQCNNALVDFVDLGSVLDDGSHFT